MEPSPVADIPRPPGPPPRGTGVAGLAEHLRRTARFIRDPIQFVGDRFRHYGDIYYAPNPGGGLYVLRHPDHLHEVLVTRAASFGKQHTGFHRLARVLGNGLLNSEGEVWRRHRRMIQPLFQARRLSGYAAIMAAEAERMADSWQAFQTQDIAVQMNRLTLNIVAQTLFSKDASSDAEAVGRAMRVIVESVGRPDLLPSPLPTPGRFRLRRAIDTLDTIVFEMIAARRRAAPAGPEDLLGALLQTVDEAGQGLTEREIRDELMTFFLAGHETTAQALTWTWYLLGENPEIQARVNEEVDRVLKGRRLQYEDLEALPYTEWVLMEAMRLYPPAYVIPRRAIEDTQIGPWPIPAGSEVVMWTFFTHRDPRLYTAPETFSAERFRPETKKALPRCAYLPFGAGSRTCIGKAFAMMEAKAIIATFAQRFTLRLAPRQKIGLKPRLTLAPKYGMRMEVIPRSTTPDD